VNDRSRGGQRAEEGAGARRGEPKRLGDVLSSALGRMATSEQGRAYAAWTRAAGDQVASGARPRHFSRGVLTVECTSSVWANELTYLGSQILRRMDEIAPGHPVKRFRFVIERAAPQQQETSPAARHDGRDERPAPPDLGGARVQAQGVRDERLRAAIEAALRTAPAEAPEAPADGPARG
jgi:predicted nucleic acid-binding Zn ribbon protein